MPMGKQDEYDIRPTEPAFRIEGEVGLGGGTVAAGFYIPAGGAFAVNIKVARLRTWLATWQEEKDTTFDGGMMELVTLGHVPGKLGLGYFEGEEAFTERRTSFTYAFMGVGL